MTDEERKLAATVAEALGWEPYTTRVGQWECYRSKDDLAIRAYKFLTHPQVCWEMTLWLLEHGCCLDVVNGNYWVESSQGEWWEDEKVEQAMARAIEALREGEKSDG